MEGTGSLGALWSDKPLRQRGPMEAWGKKLNGNPEFPDRLAGVRGQDGGEDVR